MPEKELLVTDINLLIAHAQEYNKCGFNTAPTREDKRPAVRKWDFLQIAPVPWITTAKPGEEKAPDQSSVYYTPTAKEKAVGLAVICGAGSGNLEVIDVDCKYDLTGSLFEDFLQAITDHSQNLALKLLIAKTKNGGYHLYYRCNTIAGNQKLAERESTKKEKETSLAKAREKNPKAREGEKVKVLIETRGAGGYVVAAPSPGYEFIGKTIDQCPTITIDERATLLNIARSFTQIIAAPDKPPKSLVKEWENSGSPQDSPFEDYNIRGVEHMLDLLGEHGWTRKTERDSKVIFLRPGNDTGVPSGDFHRGKNLFAVFSTSTEFIPKKGYLPASVFKMLECNNDDHVARRKLLELGYGKTNNHSQLPSSINDALKNDKKNEPELLTFWEVVAQKKTTSVKIVKAKFLTFLYEQGGFGIYRFNTSKTGYIIIQNRNNLVAEVSTEHVRKFILTYIESLPDDFDGIGRAQLMEIFLDANERLMSVASLECLPRIFPKFLRDTPNEAYYPFRNGVVTITKKGSTVRSLTELGHCIWNTQIIDRDITIEPDDLEPTEVEFYQFISKICADDISRIEYCMSILGYLLHGYKKASNSFCVIMCEETETKGGIGGTGKGILYKSLGHLVPWVFLNGKGLTKDKLNGQFLYDQVEPDTKLLVIDDALKSFDFESLFTIITEGVLVEKKYIGKVFVPFNDAPKLIITTNYVVDNTSNAARRRQRTLEFARFFHHGYTPKQHFGHELFADWSDEEWNRFYNLLFACVQQYLCEGVAEREASESLKRRAIMEKYGDRILEFFEEFKTGNMGEWVIFSDLHHQYLEFDAADIKFYSAKKFSSALRLLAENDGLKFEERTSKTTNRKKEIRIRVDAISEGDQVTIEERIELF